jgi:hypothetical protein
MDLEMSDMNSYPNAALYERRLNRQAGTIQAPPRFVEEISDWALQELAGRILHTIDEQLHENFHIDDIRKTTAELVEKETARLLAINPEKQLDDMALGSTWTIGFDESIAQLYRKYKLDVPKFFVIERPMFDQGKYMTPEVPSPFDEQRAAAIVRNMIQFYVTTLSHVNFPAFVQESKMSDVDLIELRLVRKKCQELGATEGHSRIHASSTIDVDITDWIYTDAVSQDPIVKKGPILDTPTGREHAEAIDIYSKFTQDILHIKNGLGVLTEVYEFKPGKLSFIVAQEADKWHLLWTKGGEEMAKTRLPMTSLLWYVRRLLDLHGLTAYEVEKVQNQAKLEASKLLGLDKKMDAVGLGEITLTLSMPDMPDKSESLGVWYRHPDPTIWLRMLHAPSSITAMQTFNYEVANLKTTIRHEAQHLAQNLLGELRGMTEKAGLPPPKIRDFDYNASGQKLEEVDLALQQKLRDNAGRLISQPKQKPHGLRDVEFQTNLTDAIEMFGVLKRRLPQTAHSFLAAVLIGVEKTWHPPRGPDRERIAKKYGFSIEFLKHLIANTRNYPIIPMFRILLKEDPKKWEKAASDFVKAVL